MIECSNCLTFYDKSFYRKGKTCKNCEKIYRKLYKFWISQDREKISIKICTKCLIEKEVIFFHKDSKTLSGFAHSCKDCVKKYQEKNKESISKYRNEYKPIRNKMRSERRKKDINYKILENYRGRVWSALKGRDKSKKTRDLIGCDIVFLREYLESKFTEGMSWDNYGQWHIDHIIPCSFFDLSDLEQQKKCFNYQNLQPLWAKDNLLKSNKIERTNG